MCFSHPTMRGILTGYCQIFVGLGFFFSYMLGSIFSWRNTALISLSIPIITLLAIITIVSIVYYIFTKIISIKIEY